MLLSVVKRNDGEINAIDHARVVKTFRDPLSSLSDYLSVIYRISISTVASISHAALAFKQSWATRHGVRRITENHSFTENHRKPLGKSYL